MSENDKIWLNEHLEYARTLPTYNEAFPVFEMIYRHFGATPWFHEIIREVDKVKLLFRNGDSPNRGMPATPNNMPPTNWNTHTPKTTLPKELDTARARKYFNKAKEKGWIEQNENGTYRWVGFDSNPTNTQLAYFCGKVFNYTHSPYGNIGCQFPEERLNEMFGVKHLYFLLTQAHHNNKRKSHWKTVIDEMFEY